MRNIVIGLISLYALCGAAILIHGKGHREIMTENQVEALAPTSVGDFRTIPGQTGDATLTYKMDKVTYDTLEPFGIICRVMSNPDSFVGSRPEAYDTVFIVGDGEHAFHTPEICFQTQGNEILKQDTIMVPTATRGDVPTTLLEVKNQQRGTISLAAFTFQGPKAMRASAPITDMLFNEFLTGSPKPCAFYRFMPQWEGTDPQDVSRLVVFMGKYLDEIHKTSGGKF